MDRIRDFLETLNQFELAFFCKYKLDSYMKDTQKLIKEYLNEINFNPSIVDNIISQNPKPKIGSTDPVCPRCYSDKIKAETIELYSTGTSQGAAYYLESKVTSRPPDLQEEELTCNVCGYRINDPNNERSYFSNLYSGLFKRKRKNDCK